MVNPKIKIKTLSHNDIDIFTLTVELVNEVRHLVKIYENPWGNSKVPHYDQLTKQVEHVKLAIKAYENKINYVE